MPPLRHLTISLLLALTATAQQTNSAPPEPLETSRVQSGSYSSQASSSSERVPRVDPSTSTSLVTGEIVDRVIEREHGLMEWLKTRTPLVETYLQNLKFDPKIGPTPVQDHYFLGRLELGENVDRRDYLSQSGGFERRLLGGFSRLYNIEYKSKGFSWMIFVDHDDFNRKTYDFKYAHREFLGEVRCIVFDVNPKKNAGKGRFRGRIWVEDQDYNIVRVNGIYGPELNRAYFFHMDSWRLNVVPGYWVPAYVYSEEGDFSYGSKNSVLFRAQTRLWGYNVRRGAKIGELTGVTVDSTVKDESPTGQDASPLQAQRDWMQLAEENVIERLQSAGLLAIAGDVDEVLATVANNLAVSNNIDLHRPVRTRVLLTSPLETFSVGNTIVVSRGLIDVLPDEASLAMVLAHELAHIVLGHNMGRKYAFSDRMLFSDESVYRNLGFRYFPDEEVAADKKATDILKNSPYGQKLDTAGVFLRKLAELGPALSALLTPHLGNTFTNRKGGVIRMPAVMNAAPALSPNKLDQVAALPLGGRVKVNAWDDRAELMKRTPETITSAWEKMPFEVTPFSPHVTRYGSDAKVSALFEHHDK
jgi:hypothetical protein